MTWLLMAQYQRQWPVAVSNVNEMISWPMANQCQLSKICGILNMKKAYQWLEIQWLIMASMK